MALLKTRYIKYMLWFSVISLLGLSFPFQVKMMSHWPAIFPYFLLGIALLFHPYRIKANIHCWTHLKSIDFFIGPVHHLYFNSLHLASSDWGHFL